MHLTGYFMDLLLLISNALKCGMHLHGMQVVEMTSKVVVLSRQF